MQAIEAIRFDDYTEHPIVPGGPIASVNLISGGFEKASNVVPDSCALDVDLRFSSRLHRRPGAGSRAARDRRLEGPAGAP